MSPEPKPLTEIGKYPDGTVLWNEEYTLSRLWAVGNRFIRDSVEYIVQSCTWDKSSDIITTVVLKARP